MFRTMDVRRTIRRGRLAAMAVALVAAACLVACAGAGGTLPFANPSAAVAVCNRTPGGCVSGGTFSLGTLRDLSVRVQWTNVMPGTHTALVEMLAPGGAAYQTRHVPFTASDAGTAETDTIIPVSGSMITQRGITGAWSLRVSLDGQDLATQNLEIQP